MKRWYYKLLGEEFGPVPFSELGEMRSSGSLGDSDVVREENSETWVNIADALSQTPEDAGANIEDTGSDQPDIDSFQFEPTSESPNIDDFSFDDSSPNELSIDDFRIADEERVAEKPSNTLPPGEQYYVDSLGQILGPMPIDELGIMASSGALTEGDKVREGESGEWMSPIELPRIAELLLTAATEVQGEGAQMTSTTARRLSTSSGSPTSANETPEEAQAKTEDVAPTGSPAKKTSKDESSLTKEKSPKKKPAKGRKKKKKREPKKDEFLEEIFSEVFTDDGQVREDRSTEAVKNPVGQQAPELHPLPAPPGADSSPTAPPPTPDSANTAPPPPRPAPMPPASSASLPSAKPKRRNSGAGFSLPQIDAQKLGIAGGILAAAVVVLAVMFGIIPLGSGPDVDAYLSKYHKVYLVISASPPTSPEWTAFKANASKDGKVILDYFKSQGRLSAHANNQQWSVRAMVNLANCDPEDTDNLEKRYADLEVMMAKLK